MRSHHSNTTGYVVAQSGECLRIRDDERRLVYGRAFRPLSPNKLPGALPQSWFMGVIVCKGDDLQDMVAWAQAIPTSDLDRLHFYLWPDVDLGDALYTWRQAGLPEPRAYRVDGFASFHHLYGRHHGDRVYIDHSDG